MEKPILVIMAAGLGSRYGGIKQMEAVGDNGEWIMDFSLYDGYKAGFRDVVFIVREEIAEDFKNIIGPKIEGKLFAQYAIQSITDIPQEFELPIQRVKPWGTAHAVYSARSIIKNRPAMVINADDYYGPQAFIEIYKHLCSNSHDFAMVGYELKNTVTENGYFSRGICRVDDNGFLIDIIERTHIQKFGEDIKFSEDGGSTWHNIDELTPVSLNCWGFSSGFIIDMIDDFPKFLANIMPNNPEKTEYYLPDFVENMLEDGKRKVKVLSSKDLWYGVTYKEDRINVYNAIIEMKINGIYKENLWR